MSFKVTYAIDTLDTSPEVKFFDLFNEVEDYLTEEVEQRVQWAVDHSQHYISEEERQRLEEFEHSLITIEEIKEVPLEFVFGQA
tara:strand:- start:69 stop:320 length:252 start_codon:yes stop_codon:yes gene_type:complete